MSAAHTPLRVGLIGLNQGGRFPHFLGGLGKIVAATDISAKALALYLQATQMENEHGYLDWCRMLANEKPDLVIVATPHTCRDVVSKILSKKIPVIVENPVAMTTETLRQMMATAEENNVAACVNEQWLWLPGVNALRAEINRIGTIRMCRIGGKGRSAPIEMARIGSHLLSICIHYFTNNAYSVNRQSYYNGHGIRATLSTKNWIPIAVDLHPYGHRVSGCYLEVIGDNGRLRLQGGMMERLYFHPGSWDRFQTFIPPDDLQWERIAVPGTWDVEDGSTRDPLLDPVMNSSFWLVRKFIDHLRGEADNPYPLEKFFPVVEAMELVLGT